MSKFIVGGDCEVYYEDETGETLSQELEVGLMYKLTVQGEYKRFEDDELIFGLEGQEIYISLMIFSKNLYL